MPLSHPQTQAVSGNISGSRKRTHAEITRSESRSRSRSRSPPSKRRRTVLSPSQPQTSSNPNPGAASLVSTRFVGDGFDYRRPVMPTAPPSQNDDTQDTIDLTVDDDSPVPHHTDETRTYLFYDSDNEPIRSPMPSPTPRAPPFQQTARNPSQPVIDLSTDDEGDEGVGVRTEPAPDFAASSPEVEFMGARALPQPATRNQTRRARPHLPTPPAIGHFGSVFNLLTQNYFVNLRRTRELPEEALNRIDGLLDPTLGRPRVEQPPEAFDEFDDIQLDYGRTGFNFGHDLLVIEDPAFHHGVPNRVNESAYKEPAPARQGFTRNYEESDMLVCGYCGDELAVGETEQKQQVWIIKQCGHAYCGDCAHGRIINKGKNNRDSKRAATKRHNNFKNCTVPDCKKAVDSRTKMFQIYL